MRDDKVFQSLGLPPIKQEPKKLKVLVTDNKDDKVENDFDVARDSMRNVIEVAEKSLADIADLAESRGEAQDYTAFASVMKGIIAANKSLMDLHRQKQSVKPELEDDVVGKPDRITNNNFFGSTKELQDMIEKMKK